MAIIKGFLFQKNTSQITDWFFDKFHLEGRPRAPKKLENLVVEQDLGEQDAYLWFYNDLTLCLTSHADPKRLKFLSTVAKVCSFTIDTDSREATYVTQFIAMSRSPRSVRLAAKQKGSGGILGLFKKQSTGDISATELSPLFSAIAADIAGAEKLTEAIKRKPAEHYQVARPVMTYVDKWSYSTNATPFTADPKKMRDMMPSAVGYPLPFETDFDGSPMTEAKYAQRAKEVIKTGVVSPALLIQHNPLVVSVYSSDLDAILMLNFNKESALAHRYKDKPRFTKMLAVNLYNYGAPSGLTQGVELDIIEGPKSSGRWKGFIPYLIEFFVHDEDQPLLRWSKQKFKKEDWQRVYDLTVAYSHKYPGETRTGFFMYSGLMTKDFSNKYFPDLKS